MLDNMDTITEHLKVNSAAKQSLTLKYQQESWVEIAERPGEASLVEIALKRISDDVSQYKTFMAVLRDIVGMDIIVRKIQGMG